MNIGIAGWAINRRFRDEDEPLALLDFPRLAREEFGLSHIEINNVFMQSKDAAYCAEVLAASKEAGVTMWGMAVDGTGNLSAFDEDERKEAVANAMAYFEIAGHLGLKYFRVNTGGTPESGEEELALCIESYRELAAEGEKCKIAICTENHGVLSTQPDNMVKLCEGVGSEFMGTLPDYGNFAEEFRYDGIAKIMPYAVGVHAKWTRKDGPRVDVARMVQITRDGGYDGPIFIEDGGPVCDHRGVLELKGALMAAIPEYADEA